QHAERRMLGAASPYYYESEERILGRSRLLNGNDACVTLAGCGDVGTGHTPPESAFMHVADALREADLRFAQCEKLYSDKKSYQVHSGAWKIEVLKRPQTAAAFKAASFDVPRRRGTYARLHLL